jgi:uncharacterized membrane protein
MASHREFGTWQAEHWRIGYSLKTNEPAEAVDRAREAAMELHAPAMWVFILSLVLAVVAVVSVFVAIPYLSMYAFWVAVFAYVVLALGNFLPSD